MPQRPSRIASSVVATSWPSALIVPCPGDDDVAHAGSATFLVGTQPLDRGPMIAATEEMSELALIRVRWR